MKTGAKVAIGVGIVGGLGAILYFATRSSASPSPSGKGSVTFTLTGYTPTTQVGVWVDNLDSYGYQGYPITISLPVGLHTWHTINQLKNTNNQQSGTFTIKAGQNTPIALTIP